MKKITILFSIFLIINFSSTIKTANSQQDLPGGLLGGLLGVLGNVIDFLRNLLTPKFNLNDEELKDLAEKLREIAKLGYTITQEELQKRVQQVFEINKLTGGEWNAKLNLVSLLPLEAQKKLCGTLGVEVNGNTNDEPPRDKRGALRAKRADSCSYKIDFDVRNKWPRCRSIISYVHDQGQCGSCYAVSTASCYTDRRCIERAKRRLRTPNNARNTFSAYDLLSCSKEDGCNGGVTNEAWRWIQKNGICTGTDHPRNGGLTSVGAVVGEADIKNQLHTYGPVVAGFIVYEDFESYKDGVYRRVSNNSLGGHAVVITGYGTATCSGTKIPFWIIRNSWSPKWGKGGFFYMRRGTNECKIEKYISYGVPKI
uniref:Peptidase C1A papain C-terminal domain-containing protein n=1 Tax=Meloidogyne enterolobii TaxID=390850 RepID=A0A6V7VXH1_MELEN|nr:unnamed protein product [Meloidogyne enterolobii]